MLVTFTTGARNLSCANKHDIYRLYYTVKYCAWLLIYYDKIYRNCYDYYGNNYGNKNGFFFPWFITVVLWSPIHF